MNVEALFRTQQVTLDVCVCVCFTDGYTLHHENTKMDVICEGQQSISKPCMNCCKHNTHTLGEVIKKVEKYEVKVKGHEVSVVKRGRRFTCSVVCIRTVTSYTVYFTFTNI